MGKRTEMPPVTTEHWQWLGVAGLCILACLLATWITASHRVQGYYIEQSGYVSCVKSSVNWDMDHTVYCSQDINQLVSVAEKLNQTVK